MGGDTDKDDSAIEKVHCLNGNRRYAADLRMENDSPTDRCVPMYQERGLLDDAMRSLANGDIDIARSVYATQSMLYPVR